MQDNLPYDEAELLKRIAEGDEGAYEIIFKEYWSSLYGVALAISKSVSFAEDVAQEALLWVWKEREKLRFIDNFQGYLNTTARHMVYRKLKRVSLEDAYKNYTEGRVELSGDSPESSTNLRQLARILKEGIDRLPAQQQRAFLLSREQGMTHEQIAAEMKLSRSSVKDYIVKATATLRKHLKQYGDLAAFLPFL